MNLYATRLHFACLFGLCATWLALLKEKKEAHSSLTVPVRVMLHHVLSDAPKPTDFPADS